MGIKETLAQTLQELRLTGATIRVVSGDHGKVIAEIVSPAFEGMSEGDRQLLVWKQVLNRLTPGEQAQIEFVFTDAPSEVPV